MYSHTVLAIPVWFCNDKLVIATGSRWEVSKLIILHGQTILCFFLYKTHPPHSSSSPGQHFTYHGEFLVHGHLVCQHGLIVKKVRLHVTPHVREPPKLLHIREQKVISLVLRICTCQDQSIIIITKQCLSHKWRQSFTKSYHAMWQLLHWAALNGVHCMD